jgi:hypothetical protein
MKTCLTFLACLIPALAFAVPPREQNKRPMPMPASRPTSSVGTPSLSPTARPNKPNKQSQIAANGSRPSILPATSAGSRVGPGTPQLPVNPQQPRPPRPADPNHPRTGHDVYAYGRPSMRYNQPDVVVNRPDINIYRPTVNHANVNSNTNINGIGNTVLNNTVVNNTVINNNNVVNQQFNRNNQFNNYQASNYQGKNYRSARPYYPQLHYHWQPAAWGAAYQPAYYNYNYSSSGGGAWLGISNAVATYVNPFFARPTAAANTTAAAYDYSQPIRVPDPNYQETQDDLVRSEKAIRRFDDAREVFRRGEYGRASELADEAIALLPNDPTLHEFLALTLFARERYSDAAAALYSVLAVSPGWTRDTLLKLYDTPERYVAQVSALEKYAAATPEAIDARFLLAYHQLITGDLAGAKRQLEIVRIAKPTDQVVQSLLTALGEATAG